MASARAMARFGTWSATLSIFLLFGVGFAAAEAPVVKEVPAPRTTEAAPAQAAGTAGLRVYIDPVTGEFTAPPPRSPIAPLGIKELNPGLRKALSRSRHGLVPVRNTGPGGGVTLDLQGRFQQGSMAVANPDGSVSVGEVSIAPSTPAAAE